MKQVMGSDGGSLNNLKLYAISKRLSDEILLEEFVQSRGAYYTAISEDYVKSKKQLKKKVIYTKIFYAIVFGILPVIPVFAYFEFIRLVTSGAYEFELIIFSISILYGLFFLLQFFNFLLMAILETTVIMSGKATEWFKTLPFTNFHLNRIVYFSVLRNFDIPIITIVLSFPVAMLIGTLNIFIFLVSLGISFVNTFLALNLIIIISERLNRILNINDASSKKTFFIRLFNIFSYLFLIIGSVYIVQWATTSIGDFINLFVGTENPGVINIILSSIPYPLSQCYLIALMFAPNFTNLPIWLATFVGIGILLLLLYLSSRSAHKAIRRSYHFIAPVKLKTTYLEDLKNMIKVKPRSSFIAFLRKDLTAATRDIKVFLSFITPILVSFIFVIYLNLQNIDPTEPVQIQMFRVWLACLLVSPIIGSILVFSLLNLEATGQTILDSLPLVPREQAKAKLFLMFIILNLSILSPIILFVGSPRFLIYVFGILLSIPFAWIFLFISFELRIYFFGKHRNSYIVGDSVIGSSFFKLVVIFILPLSICVWLISMSTLFFVFIQDFIVYFSLLIGAFLVAGVIFIAVMFDKLFPIIKEREEKVSTLQSTYREVSNPTFFTRHVWVSIILVYQMAIVNIFIIMFVRNLFYLFINPTWSYPLDTVQIILYFLYNLFTPFVTSIFNFSLYLYFLPKVLGIPYGRKRIPQFLNDIGCDWLSKIIKYWRHILFGTILITAITIGFFAIIGGGSSGYFTSDYTALIGTFAIGFWQEITFRGIFLTFLSKRYKNTSALLQHLGVVMLFTYITPMSSMLLIGFSFFSFEFLIYNILFLSYHLILGYIYLKSKNLLPNIIIVVIFTILFYPLGYNPLFIFVPYYF